MERDFFALKKSACICVYPRLILSVAKIGDLTDNTTMIKTYDIDLDDELVEAARNLFASLGSDIDSAIKIFLKQSLLRKGFPFEVALPQESADALPEESSLATETSAPEIAPEVESRVAANEALVAQMRAEIGDKDITPEFDPGEEEQIEKSAVKEAASPAESKLAQKTDDSSAGEENVPSPDSGVQAEEASDEDEDETAPENLFDAWNVGEEEDIGCR